MVMGQAAAEEEEEEEEETQSPLLEACQSDETQPAAATHLNKRTGTVWTASAHIITGVIGAGVLSLAWSVAQLGWVAGPAAILLFAAITLVSTYLLSDCYRYPHPEHGPNRISSYTQAVKFFLGDANQLLCALISQESLFGCGIAYTITAAASIHWSNLVNLIGFLRTTQLGTLWTCIAHIITAVIGAGVLSLTWSTAQLGWIAGPLCLLLFAIITYVSSFLLADCYRTCDTATRSRNRCYTDAVKLYLGRKRTWVCGLLQNISFYGTAIAYVITTSTSMRAIQKSNCYHREGHSASCSYGDSFYMLIFGAVQIVMSQIPDFHNMEWLSIIAAIMSFTYAFIGFALGLAKVIENGSIKGSIIGVPTSSTADKLWLVFQAVGDIAFAYPYAIILLEIQDTLKSPPPENQTMKKASMAAIFITTFFYLCCGCFGYAAFGNDAPGNLLTGFGFYEPYWLIDFANACIVVHLVGGYQIFSQPVFAFVEKWFTWKFPNSRFVNEAYTLKLPLLPGFQMNPLKLCFRTAYVVSTTGIAMIFPYFNQVLGVLGALNFWPLAIYFPVEMYFVQKKVGAWSRKWIVLRLFSLFCLIVSILALIGSVQGLITAKLG